MNTSNVVRMGAVLVAACGLVVAGCDQKPPSNTSGSGTTGTTAPSGGAKSLAGKVVETSKDVANRATEKGKEVGAAAENAYDAAKGAWADLRASAVSESQKRLDGFKAKMRDLEARNPALFTTVENLRVSAEAKLAELKNAGADAWRSIADDVKAKLDEIETRLKG